jgi:hypothetical protein
MKDGWLVLIMELHHLLVCGFAILTTFPQYSAKKKRSDHVSESTQRQKENFKDAQECGESSNDKSQEEEGEDQRDLAPRQEARDSSDALRVRVDKGQLASRKLGDTRQVARVPAVPLEMLRAIGGARHDRADLVSGSIDGRTLQGLAEVRVSRLRVGHEAANGGVEDLIE